MIKADVTESDVWVGIDGSVYHPTRNRSDILPQPPPARGWGDAKLLIERTPSPLGGGGLGRGTHTPTPQCFLKVVCHHGLETGSDGRWQSKPTRQARPESFLRQSRERFPTGFSPRTVEIGRTQGLLAVSVAGTLVGQ